MSVVLIVILVVSPVLGGLCFCMGFCAGSAWVARQHLDKYESPPQQSEQKIHPPPIPPVRTAKLVRQERRPTRESTHRPVTPTLPPIAEPPSITVPKKKKKIQRDIAHDQTQYARDTAYDHPQYARDSKQDTLYDRA